MNDSTVTSAVLGVETFFSTLKTECTTLLNEFILHFGSLLNTAGLSVSIGLTLLILFVDIISFLRGRKDDSLLNPMEASAFKRSKVNALLAFITAFCSIWFIIELVYIYLKF